MKIFALLELLVLSSVSFCGNAQSAFGLVTRNVRDFGAKGDGITDDTGAFLRALNEGRGNVNGAKAAVNVFVPGGTYLLSDTIILWKSTQLYGDWQNPPVLKLGPHAPGFDDAINPKPFIVTANGYNMSENSSDWRTRTGSTNNIFFLYLRDLDIEIENGNPGAWGLYWLVAQQTALRNVRIRAGTAQGCIRSMWWGGGGVIANVTCEGGDFGWQVTETSQFLVRSSVFRGQRKASVALANPWMITLLDTAFQNTAPVQITGGMAALLDCSFSTMLGSKALDMKNGTFRLENVHFESLSQVPEELKSAADSGGRVGEWSSKPVVRADREDSEAGHELAFRPAGQKYEIRAYPRPGARCANIRDLGATGNGVTDDTRLIRKALAEHDEIFFPLGDYKVSAGLKIRPGHRLFGEVGSRILLADGSPGFEEGSWAPFIEVQKDKGIGITLCGLTFENQAHGGIACLWNGSINSSVFDTQFVNTRREPLASWEFVGGGGWIENAWIPGDNKFGVIVRSTEPLWLYALAPEHYGISAVQLLSARNVTMINLQMETSPLYLIIGKSSNVCAVGILAGNWNGQAKALVNLDGSAPIQLWNLGIAKCTGIVAGAKPRALYKDSNPIDDFSRLAGLQVQ